MVNMYYVYQLIDPRNGVPFYIGKGKGNRVDQHEKDAEKGIAGSKCDMIRDIWTDGYNVQKEIIKRFKNEDSAYKYEEKMIASIGLDNLTNITKGGRSVCFNQLKERNDAKRLIKSIARGFHILDKNKEIQLRFCGILIDLDKTSVLEMFHRGLSKVTSVLGESLVNKEFSKYGVVIANND